MRLLHFLDERNGDVLQHVRDLALAQAADGHEVGLVVSDAPRNQAARDTLAQMETACLLGISVIPMSASLSLSDVASTRAAFSLCKGKQPALLHSHGLKPGIIARAIGSLLRRTKHPVSNIHSPHSDGLDEESRAGMLLKFEPQLLRRKRTRGLVFESAYAKTQYETLFGGAPCPAEVIHHGVRESDFVERQIVDSAADFLFIGELKRAEGVDLLIQALGRMKTTRHTGALIVGSGPEEKELRKQVDRYSLSHQVFFSPPQQRRLAFLKGGCLVVPTRHDAFPRIVLEAAAAEVPMILADRGGVRELIGDIAVPLIEPDSVEALVKELTAYLETPKPYMERALDLKQRVAREFTAKRMTDATESFYRRILGEG